MAALRMQVCIAAAVVAALALLLLLPGRRRKYGLDHESLLARCPRLIVGGINGYGSRGQQADWPAFDYAAYFARTGIMDGSRYDDAVPGVTMPAQGDRAAGMALAAAIMIALWNREKTGKGTKVSSSLFANGIWANGNAVQAALIGAPLPKRPPPDRPRSALANVYRTRDDRWFQLTLVREDRDWPGVCRAARCDGCWMRRSPGSQRRVSAVFRYPIRVGASRRSPGGSKGSRPALRGSVSRVVSASVPAAVHSRPSPLPTRSCAKFSPKC